MTKFDEKVSLSLGPLGLMFVLLGILFAIGAKVWYLIVWIGVSMIWRSWDLWSEACKEDDAK
jgi:hypothetical protein